MLMARHWDSRTLTASAAVLVGCVLLMFADAARALWHQWLGNETHSYGLLVPLVSATLCWQLRFELARVPGAPSGMGATLVLLAASLWYVGTLASVDVVSHFALLAMPGAIVCCVYGLRVARVLAFPLAYLILALPFGEFLTPTLMQTTADIAVAGLRASGVPVFREAMTIAIPEGTFLVARECSGLNYTVAGIAIGTLYSYLTYRKPTKRVVAVLAFVVVPILANGVRVYLTILVSRLTNMEYGPGVEHVWFGRILFAAVIASMVMIGLLWRDSGQESDQVAPPEPRPGRCDSTHRLWPVGVALGGLGAVASAQAAVTARLELVPVTHIAAFHTPGGRERWRSIDEVGSRWVPHYSGEARKVSATFATDSGDTVDFYVGAYIVGRRGSKEMISHHNRIFEADAREYFAESTRRVELRNGQILNVIERNQWHEGRMLRVWYWFSVDSHPTTSRSMVKFRDLSALLSGRVSLDTLTTISTSRLIQPELLLTAFLETYSQCVAPAAGSAPLCR